MTIVREYPLLNLWIPIAGSSCTEPPSSHSNNLVRQAERMVDGLPILRILDVSGVQHDKCLFFSTNRMRLATVRR